LTRKTPPLILKWKEVPTAISTYETKMEFESENADDLHKNAARMSSRLKKLR